MGSSVIRDLSGASKIPGPAAVPPAHPQEEGQRCYAYGLYGLETFNGEQFQWTRRFFGFYFEAGLWMITLKLWVPQPVQISALINGTAFDVKELRPGDCIVSFAVDPARAGSALEVSFRLHRSWQAPDDRRKLGVLLFELLSSGDSKVIRYSPASFERNATRENWLRCAPAFEVEKRAQSGISKGNGGLNILERTEGVDRVSSTPTKLYLEIAWLCSLRCPSCFHAYVTPEHRRAAIHFMSSFVFQRVVEELFPGALMVWYNGNGESLLHPNIETILQSAREFDFIPALLTSGGLFTERNMRALVEGGFFLSISVDSPYEKDFERLRAGVKFSKLVAAIEYMRELNRGLHNPRFNLRIQCVAQRSNLEQLSPLVEWAARYGIEEVQFLPLQNFGNVPAQLEEIKLQRVPDYANRKMLEALRTGTRLGVRVRPFPPFDPDESFSREFQAAVRENLSWATNADQFYHQIAGIAEAPSNYPDRRCHLAWSECFIGADGKVAPCDMYLDVTTAGNLYDDDFREIWNSPQMVLMRQTVNTNPTELCRFGTCMFRPTPPQQAAGGPMARPSINQVRQEGSTILVAGNGFTPLSVVNFFIKRDGGDVNLGGIDSDDSPVIDVTLEGPTSLSFTVPQAALPGPCYVQVTKPPFTDANNSGTGPSGLFVLEAL